MFFIRNADKVLLQIIEIPEPYVAGFREEPKNVVEDPVKMQVSESVPEPEAVSVPEEPDTIEPVVENVHLGSVFDRLLK